jgi:hypothetical protein
MYFSQSLKSSSSLVELFAIGANKLTGDLTPYCETVDTRSRWTANCPAEVAW